MVLDVQPELPQIQVVGVGVGLVGVGGTRTTSHLTPLSTSIAGAPSSSLTLNLFHPNPSSPSIELEELSPLPFGWQKFLNLQSGEISYEKDKQLLARSDPSTMSRNGRSPKLDLKLNLSPPRVNPLLVLDQPNRSSRVSSTPTSPTSSCLSSELNNDDLNLRYSNSPEATSMVLVGCPRCLMYVMLSEDNPKCPKCKSTVLLDFLHESTCTKKTRNN